MDTQHGRRGIQSGVVRILAMALVMGVALPLMGLTPMRTSAASEFDVNGDEISGWWWLRDGAGEQSAHWVFDELPVSGSVTILFELLATDTVSGGPGVDARFWLTFGPVIDGEELEATTAPLLMALPNVSPPDDPLGYWTRGWYGFPTDALALSAAESGAVARFRQRERGGTPGELPVVEGLWVTIGRLGPDGSVTSEHIAVRESSVQLQAGPSVGETEGEGGTAEATPEPTLEPTPTPEPTPEVTPEPTPEPTPTPGPSGPPEGTATIVSIGDSFISGEAGRWAGNTNDSYALVDALGPTAYHDTPGGEAIDGCHRSRSAEVHIGDNPYGPDVETINLACSGATTQTSYAADVYKPGVDRCPNDTGCPDGALEGQATMLHEVALTHNVDLVVLSIGGNDFAFSDTVTQCGEDYVYSSYFEKDFCHDDGSVLARFSDDNVAQVQDQLVDAYEAVIAAMTDAGYDEDDWTLLIQTYPSPLPPGGDIRYWQTVLRHAEGGCPFWNEDADWANDTALPLINSTIAAAVDELDASNVAILDVSQVLIGHRLCEDTVELVGDDGVGHWTWANASDESEWVAQIRAIFSQGGAVDLPGSVYFKNESFHPNYWGQLALRNCLRQAYNGGNIRGGTCLFMQDGLNDRGEPMVQLYTSGG